jgi:serine phosphatase RsbU (regulator of sigma subunit)
MTANGTRTRIGSGSRTGLASVALAGTILVVLYLTSLHSYLLFHVFAELAFVIAVCAILTVAWNLREFLDDDFTFFLGVALFFVAVLHVVHAVDFPGMGVFKGHTTDSPTQLWVAAGYLSSLSFALAPAVIGRRIRAIPVVAAYASVCALLLASIFTWKVFPHCYLNGSGLTPFKKISEYVIVAIYVLAMGTLITRRRRLDPGVLRLLLAALVVLCASEVAFTLYVRVYTAPNMIGHLLMVLAAFLIYKATVEAGLAKPHALAVASLRVSEGAARAAQQEADTMRRALDDMLEITGTFPVEAGYDETARVICAAARRVFECSAASLYRVVDHHLQHIAREPATLAIGPESGFAINDIPGLDRVIRTRMPTFVGDVAERHPAAFVEAMLGSLGIASVLFAPVGMAPVADKVLLLSWPAPREQPGTTMLALARRFTDQAAIALAQAGRAEAQEEAARLHQRLESSLLSRPPAESAHIRVARCYRPGERRLRLGGDFIGVVALPDDRLAVVVGDVSGHGPDAAALGAMLRASWQALTLSAADVTTTMTALAGVLDSERGSRDMFATLCAAWIDPVHGCAEILNVGHPAPLLVSRGVAQVDVPPLPPLGVWDDVLWQPRSIDLAPGWSLFFYTDGLVEGRVAGGNGERYGEARLAEAIGRLLEHDRDEAALDRLLAEVEQVNGAPFGDDVAVVLVSDSRSE